MASATVFIRAEWDAEAEVWYVAETSLPGLNAEADTVEALVHILPAMVQDLLDDDGTWPDFSDRDALTIEVTAHATTIVRRDAA